MNPIQEILTDPVAQRALLGGVEELGFLVTTTVLHHRQGTHQSVEVSPAAGYTGDALSTMTGTIHRYWVGAHLKHHRFTDVNLVQILRVKNYIDWLDTHPEEALDHPSVPDVFPEKVLDPAAEFTREQIMDIGSDIDDLVIRPKTGERVKDLYDAPENYTKEEAEAILATDKPRYFYAPRPTLLRKLLRQKTPVETPPERSLEWLTPELRDPHSPILHENWTWGILRGGIGQYREVVAHDTQVEKDNGGADESEVRHFEKFAKAGPYIFILGNVAVGGTLGFFDGGTAAAIGRDAALGLIPPAIAFGLYMIGSNIVNALGHSGRRVLKAFLGKEPELNEEDGTYTSNSAIAGAFTVDEAGAQDPHHKGPGRIAFSFKKRLKKFIQAPFGTNLEVLATKIGIGVRPGKQFNRPGSGQFPPSIETNPEDLRPDEPAMPVLKIQALRVQTHKKSSENSESEQLAQAA